jgi:hypothetical protein
MNPNFQQYKQSLNDWKNYQLKSLGSIDVNFKNQDPRVNWIETYSIGEIPLDDNWKTSATEFKLWQEDKYQEWGHIKEATQHYMSFEPELPFDINIALSIIGCNSPFQHSFLKLPAGRMIPWHCDTYAYFIKKYDVPEQQVTRIKRAIVCVNDWDVGQSLQVGKNMLSGWSAGDMYTWDHDAWHGAANFGNQDLIFMQITYYE